MIEVELACSDRVALVNDEHGYLVERHVWRELKAPYTTYAVTFPRNADGKRTSLYMHRLVLGLEPGDRMTGDHIRHDGLDNRVGIGLRLATPLQQQLNCRPHRGRFKGVHWSTQKGKWTAGTSIYGCRHHFGFFSTEEDAARAYDAGIVGLLTPEDLQYAYLNRVDR